MAEEKTTRKRRTREELIAATEEKIKAENKRHEETLKKLNEELEKLKGTTLSKAQKQKMLNEAIKKAGLTPEEQAKKLGLKMDW